MLVPKKSDNFKITHTQRPHKNLSLHLLHKLKPFIKTMKKTLLACLGIVLFTTIMAQTSEPVKI